MNGSLTPLSRSYFLVCPVRRVLHVSGLRNRALYSRQTERAFRETGEILITWHRTMNCRK